MMLAWMLGNLDLVHQGVSHWATIGPDLWHLSTDGLVLAQNTDADLVAQAQQAWKTFIETGQVWAFLIGLIIGYAFRTFTTYG